MTKHLKARPTTASDDRQYMGTAEDAEAGLAERARAYREFRQPSMATASEHRKREALEREARLLLAGAALVWLWHHENPEA